jgi:hypothetical protein
MLCIVVCSVLEICVTYSMSVFCIKCAFGTSSFTLCLELLRDLSRRRHIPCFTRCSELVRDRPARDISSRWSAKNRDHCEPAKATRGVHWATSKIRKCSSCMEVSKAMTSAPLLEAAPDASTERVLSYVSFFEKAKRPSTTEYTKLTVMITLH